MVTVKEELRIAFDELLQAFGEKVIINGQERDALVEEIASMEQPIPGGSAESEEFRVRARFLDFADPPKQGDKGTIRRRELEVVRWLDRNEVEYEITYGSLLGGE